MANYWFKHYNTAHEGLTLRTLWDSGQFEAYGLFWILLELISRYEEENLSGKLKIQMGSLQRITGWNLQRLTRVLTKIGETSSEVQGIQVRINLDQTCELLVPKWLELQETRGGKRLAKNEQSVDRSKKKEVRSKKTPIVPLEGTSKNFDLEILYQNYPRKVGKTLGLKKLSTVVKTQEDFDAVCRAIENYKNYLKRNGTEAQYIKHFSTFVSSWQDWLDPAAGQSEKIIKQHDYSFLKD